MDFPALIRGAAPLLTEGAVIERLRRDPRVKLDEHVLHTGFLYQPGGRALLSEMYREYLEIGRDAGLPLAALTPTWRANEERLKLAGLGDRDVNGDAVRFLRSVSAGFGTPIGGCTGCRGDAYDAGEALTAGEAEQFHSFQVRALARAGADFLLAATLPAASEALGIARAMASTQTPYLLSFIVSADGCLLDGTPLKEAIRSIDVGAAPAPTGYMINCVHHSVFAAAAGSWDVATRQRVVGLQANTSARSPEALDGASELEGEDPSVFASGMVELRRRFSLNVLGGCCGTDARHIRALADRLT